MNKLCPPKWEAHWCVVSSTEAMSPKQKSVTPQICPSGSSLVLKMAPDAGVTPAAGWTRSSWWPSGVHGRSCLSSSPLEEGGVWGKGTCKSEVLLGKHAVHALWQGFGVGRRPRHSGPQDKLPAYRRWEVGYRVLSSLLWVARPLQLLLWQSHCSSLE